MTATKSQSADILEAYIGMIREANHCIYIENQFCESASSMTEIDRLLSWLYSVCTQFECSCTMLTDVSVSLQHDQDYQYKISLVHLPS